MYYFYDDKESQANQLSILRKREKKYEVAYRGKGLEGTVQCTHSSMNEFNDRGSAERIMRYNTTYIENNHTEQ